MRERRKELGDRNWRYYSIGSTCGLALSYFRRCEPVLDISAEVLGNVLDGEQIRRD